MSTDILPRDLSISQTIRVLVPDLVIDTMGVAALSDAAAADVYNDRTLRTAMRDTLSGLEILSCIVPGEYAALPINQPTRHATVMGICGVLGEIPIGPDTFARRALMNIFGDTSATVAALQALVNIKVSRAQELDLPPLTARDITAARDWIARNP